MHFKLDFIKEVNTTNPGLIWVHIVFNIGYKQMKDQTTKVVTVGKGVKNKWVKTYFGTDHIIF